MKKIIILLTLIVFWGCSKTDRQNESLISCKNSVKFGDIDICLPDIDGMTECYDLPNVKPKADRSVMKGSSVIAFYLNNNTYKHVDQLGEINFDDFSVIYSSDNYKSVKFTQDDLNQMYDIVRDNFFQENWDVIKDKIEKDRGYLSIGKPVVVDIYSPHEKIKTLIMLTKIQKNNNEYIMLGSTNFLLLKDRFINLSYYKFYEGADSVKMLKAKNDYIVLSLLQENIPNTY